MRAKPVSEGSFESFAGDAGLTWADTGFRNCDPQDQRAGLAAFFVLLLVIDLGARLGSLLLEAVFEL